MAFWRWANFATDQAQELGRPTLWINLDETSLVQHPTNVRGTVVAKLVAGRDVAPLAHRRSCVTLLAAIASKPEVKLPQLLLCNERQLPQKLLRVLPERGCVLVWREKSAWVSQSCFRRYLTVLAKHLTTWIHSHTVIVVADVARCHLAPATCAHAQKLGMRMLLVPARATAWLQPLDTSTFAVLKRVFLERWRETKAESQRISMRQWLDIVFAVVQDVLLGQSWREAFFAVGLLGRQKYLSSQCLQGLGLASPPEVPLGPPSEQEASQIFPRGNKSIDAMGFVLWTQAACSRPDAKRPAPKAAGAPRKCRRLPGLPRLRKAKTLD